MTCNNKGGCCDADNAAVLQALYGLKEMVTEWDDEGESWTIVRHRGWQVTVPEPPASLVELVSVASREIYAACGFNSVLPGQEG